MRLRRKHQLERKVAVGILSVHRKQKGRRWKPSSNTPGKATKKCTLWWHQGSVRGEARLVVVLQGKLATKMPHSPVLLDQGRGGMFYDLENSRLESID